MLEVNMPFVQLSDFPDSKFNFNISNINYVCVELGDTPDRDFVWYNWPQMRRQDGFLLKGYKIPDGRTVFEAFEQEGSFVTSPSNIVNGKPKAFIIINVNPKKYLGAVTESLRTPDGISDKLLDVRFKFVGGNDIICLGVFTPKELAELQRKIDAKQQEIMGREATREGGHGNWAGSVQGRASDISK
jgi:hypothetical protein